MPGQRVQRRRPTIAVSSGSALRQRARGARAGLRRRPRRKPLAYCRAIRSRSAARRMTSRRVIVGSSGHDPARRPGPCRPGWASRIAGRRAGRRRRSWPRGRPRFPRSRSNVGRHGRQRGQEEHDSEIRVGGHDLTRGLDRGQHGGARRRRSIGPVERLGDGGGAEQEVQEMQIREVAKAVDIARLPRRDLEQTGDLGHPAGESPETDHPSA